MTKTTLPLPPVGTVIRVGLPDDAPRRVRHRHTNKPVVRWVIAGYEGDVMRLEGQAVDCDLDTVMNAISRYRDVYWEMTLTDEHREVLATYIKEAV